MGKQVYNQWRKTVVANGSATVTTEEEPSKAKSFEDLDAMTRMRVHDLEQLTRPANRIVAFQFSNSAEWLSIFLACQAVEAIALPIDPDVPPASVNAILETLRVSALIDGQGIRPLEFGTRRRPACLIKLTSGSTGAPRPLFFSDEQMLADGHNIMQSMGITAKDSNLATIPMGHSYGLGNLIMPCIMKGCPIHVCREAFPHALAEAIARDRPTIYPTVPAILRALARSDVNPADFASIRLWISAGSPLETGIARTFQQKFGQPVHNFYGSSETGGIAYDRTGKATLEGEAVGKPLHGVTVSLAPSGRLVVSSKAVYTRNNQMRTEPVGSCRLPDLARILEDGSIRLLGRTARIAKLGGKRLALAEIEAALKQLREVEDCYVDVYKDSTYRMRLAAVVVASVPGDQLAKCLKSRLSAWKTPSRWIVLQDMPVNRRGKLDRVALKHLITQSNRRTEKP